MDDNATDLGSVLNDQPADTGAAASQPEQHVDQGAPRAEPPAAERQEADHVPRAALQDERRKRQDMERELDHYRRLALQAQQTQRPAPQQEAQQAPKGIKPEQFNTYEEYLEAVAEAKAEERATKVFEQRMREHNEQQRQAQIQQATANDVADVLTAGRSKYADFDDVVSNPSLMISDQMMNAMLVVDGGHEVGYHLGKNPAEAYRIYQLPPSSQAREIGKLAKQLANPEPSQAPVKLPQTLTQTRSANGQYAQAYSGPTPLSDILKSKGK